MCLERIHRFMMAAVLGLAAFLIYQANPYGQWVLWFVIGMLAVYGVSNFCPSVWIMEKLGLRSCAAKRDK